MEENEVEEGEACSSQEDAAAVGPGVALSHIDEKIRDVLGHFQKEFEDRLCAKNLGSKFGEYGSFLPTYIRSPSILSRGRNPRRMPNQNNPISPCTLPAEGAYHKPAVSVSASVSLENNSVPVAPHFDDLKRNDTCISAPFLGEFTPQDNTINKLSKSNDQKIPKFRIKVGSHNVLPRPNSAIYRDMGLDYSPSSSPENSPGESRGLSLESQDSCGKSPISVLKIMECFPLPDGYVLSPLPDSVLHLMENERLYPRDCKFGTLAIGVETHDFMKSETLPASNRKVLLEKEVKHAKTMRPLETKNVNCNADTMNEVYVEKPVGRMLVSDALNTLIQPSSGDADEKADRQQGSAISRGPNKVLGKHRELLCDLSEEDPLDSMPCLDTRMLDTVGNDYHHLNGKPDFGSCSSDKVLEERKLTNHKGAQLDLHNKGRGGAEKNCDAFNSTTDILNGGKDMIVEPTECIKLKAPQWSTLHEREGERDHRSGIKRKTKRSDGIRCADGRKENIKVISSVELKEKKKRSLSNRDYSEDKQNSLKSRKSSRILSKEFNLLGKTKHEPLKYGSDLFENVFIDTIKDPVIGNEKQASAFAEKPKEKSSVENVENLPKSEGCGKGFFVSPSIANGSTADEAPAPSSHVVVQDNWVCCDKCHKWRLLPYWKDPVHLPNKWLCTMLNWLPGMNKCSFSEEETTTALHALYQSLLPENQSTTNGPGSNNAPGAVTTNIQHVHQNHILSLHMTSRYEKKKNTPEDVPCEVMKLCNSAKSQRVSIKSRSQSQNQVESNAIGKSSFQYANKSAELNVEMVNKREKEYKIVKRCPTGGKVSKQNEQPLKSKSRRGSDQDGPRTSKKVKTKEAHNGDGDWYSDRDLTGKSLPVLSGGSLSKVTAKSCLGYNDNSSFKESKCNSKDRPPGSRNKPKTSIKISSSGDCKGHFSTSYMENDKKGSSGNKREVKEKQEYQVHPEAVVGSRFLVDDRANFKGVINESKSRKEKKASISKTEERETFTIMMDGKIVKKGQVARLLLSSNKEHPFGGMQKKDESFENEKRGKHQDTVESELNMDCLGSKRDLAYVQTSAAATSSSSKVSGSSKSKSNFEEAQGSPVESVSSSPLRISNVDKFSSKKNTVGRDDPVNPSFSALRSSRRCSNGEVVGQMDQYGSVKWDNSSLVVYNKSMGGYPDVNSEARNPAEGASGYLDREASSLSVGKAKYGIHLKSSRSLGDDHLPLEFEENTLSAGNDIQGKNSGHDLEKQKSHSHSKCWDQQKSFKNSSSQPDKDRSSRSDFDKCKTKSSRTFSEKEDICPTKNGDSLRHDAGVDLPDPSTCHEDLRDGRCKGVEKDKKERKSVGIWSIECRRDGNSYFGLKDKLEDDNLLSKQHGDLHTRDNNAVTLSSENLKPGLHDNAQKIISHEDERLSSRTQKLETAPERGKLHHLSHSGDKKLTSSQDPQTMLSNTKGGRSEVSYVDASKVLKQPKVDSQSGTLHGNLVHMVANGFDGSGPIRGIGNHPAASVALKEARNIKHIAKQLKSEGREYESTGLCFEAALKFLYVASLLESASAESGKHLESTQSMMMYSQTAKLCECCAHEYENWKEMAAAALAYKCMEVAYMKAVSLRHFSASKDWHELQAALHMVPPGESPSSSASDIDSINNQSMLDKTASAMGVNSPQVAGTNVIATCNRPVFVCLLNYVQDVNDAMEASRKSHNALRAANDHPEKSHCGPEGIASVRRVLDFSFHDIEGFLHLVQLSMDSISC